MKKKLEDKTVLIAGRLSEIGKACAVAAIREGANVVIADVVSAENKIALEEIRNERSSVLFVPCDISIFEEVQVTIKKIVNTFGKIDIALNNSEIDYETGYRAGKMNKKAWLEAIGLNLNGVFNCMSHELTEMAKQKRGVVLNLVSISSKPTFSNSPHYVATKSGIIGLTKTAALEYKNQGIRINALCPGFLDSQVIDKNETVVHTMQSACGLVGVVAEKIEKAKEVANGFVFMASEKNPFITGTAIEIDGGYLSQ